MAIRISYMADKITSFTDLEAWQQAHLFAVGVYKTTKDFPASEQFGITSQLRRAAVSIPSNIAEGFSRSSSKEKLQFYAVARASLVEVQSQILIARDVGFLPPSQFDKLSSHTIRVHKLINGLIGSVKSWSEPNTKYEKPEARVKSEIL